MESPIQNSPFSDYDFSILTLQCKKGGTWTHYFVFQGTIFPLFFVIAKISVGEKKNHIGCVVSTLNSIN